MICSKSLFTIEFLESYFIQILISSVSTYEFGKLIFRLKVLSLKFIFLFYKNLRFAVTFH